jgi:hypothetical protein
MSWEDIENAMQAAVAEASGFDARKVYWSYQDYNEKGGDYAVITFGGGAEVGQDFIQSSTDLTRPNGQEILRQVVGTREVPFLVEVFTAATDGGSAARHVAEIIRGKMKLGSIRARVRRAHVSPFDSSDVGWVPDILAAKFRGRATVTLRCYVPLLDCYEYVGYIARVTGRHRILGHLGSSGSSGIAFDYAVGSTAGTLPVYYGLAVPGTIDEAFIEALSGTALAAGLERSIAFAAGSGLQKAYYAFPSSYGTPAIFRDLNTGFDIPNTLVGSAVPVTDDAGTARSYDVWATDDFPMVAFTEQVA